MSTSRLGAPSMIADRRVRRPEPSSMTSVSYARRFELTERRTMGDDVQRPEGERSSAKRMLRNAARPFVGYFNRRFEDLHTHVDNPASLQHVEAVMHRRVQQLPRGIPGIPPGIAPAAHPHSRLALP